MKIRYRIDQEFVRLFMRIQLVVEKSCSVVLQPLKAFNGFRGEYGLKKIFKWFLKASENFLKLCECACVALYMRMDWVMYPYLKMKKKSSFKLDTKNLPQSI